MVHKNVVPRIHRIKQAYTNFYIIEGDDGLTIVDTGFPSGWKLLLDALQELNFVRGDIKALLITHAHFDHLGFAARAKTELGIPIWIHKNETYTARHPYSYDHESNRFLTPLQHPRSLLIMASMVKAGALSVKGIEAQQIIDNDISLDVPGRPHVIFTPGHTHGHCVFHFANHGALLTGDALVTLNPYTGKTGPQIISKAATANSTQALDSLNNLVAATNTVILPGHGEPWTDGIVSAVIGAQNNGIT